jgi:hypothetical protein
VHMSFSFGGDWRQTIHGQIPKQIFHLTRSTNCINSAENFHERERQATEGAKRFPEVGGKGNRGSRVLALLMLLAWLLVLFSEQLVNYPL